MRTVRPWHEHRCAGVHESGEEFVRCAWPHAAVSGAGGYAVLARCASERLYADPYPVARVVLSTDLQAARRAAKQCDDFGCGFAVCTGSHDVVWLAVAGGEDA